MQRLLVALLAAFDAAIAAAVGLVVLLAPLTLLWTLSFGMTADWGALWPLTGTLWQFGHGVPLDLTLADDVLRAAGIAPQAASFALSVTPLAFLVFTLLFAARSGARAAKAGAWALGAVAGTAAFGLIATAVAFSTQISAARTDLALSIALPTVVYLVGAVGGGVRIAWEDGDGGLLDRLHDVVDSWGDWGPVLGASVRGTAFAVLGMVAVSGVAVAVMTLARGSEVVALFQAARVDALGATVLTLGHLAYLPTILVWAASWIVGPGFAVGVGTAVSPAGTQLGVVPGIPILGLLPENSSIWMLIVVILPIGAGAVAGWAVRSRLVWEGTPLATGPRAAIAVGIGVLTAAVGAVAAVLASGSMGPGRLSEAGPSAVLFALALGGEVLLGAAILLLSPRNRDELAEERTDRWVAEMTAADLGVGSRTDLPISDTVPTGPSSYDTAPLDDLGGVRAPRRNPADPLD
ncbi:hypothetical protein DXT68_04620 [Microbacterium foliorum]|uniref:Uncharacterized protein n=1 Tax=Microbacterium foliorum TaxID=104336 RepID=A0A0F0KU63_9MICO|nr:DUF6350 family protein [Microbacterium foliorum]AXL11499.1 hypothetical protein DXT68_04620 [Microbacterium foliorum]KJL24403.1 hypothetical protein RN50_00752 [Microbacterium foliorum]